MFKISKKHILLSLVILATTALNAETESWQEQVGAQSFPNKTETFLVNDYDGVKNNGLILCTKAIQKAIDDCSAAGGGKVYFKPGTYLTGSIFLKDNVNLCIDEGVELRGIIDLEEYPEIYTRVAGIEMKWPAAIINFLNIKNAAITGKGSIHAQGRYHWERYWKLRQAYTPKGLRWASDYDCKRVRTILVSNSKNSTIQGITLKQAGFWTVHVLYSNHITVDGITIQNNIDGHGPSTDGIDLDSSSDILVKNCDIDCNDDNFCLKSGRDADGLRVNRPCERIVIHNCISRKGGGLITLGSETSGGIKDVEVYNLKANGTNIAIRFKSALTRGGTIENINIHDIEMKNVDIAISASLNWNPSYSYASVGKDTKDIPKHWKVMLEKVSPEDGLPHFKNISVSNIEAKNCKTAISLRGIENSHLENFSFKNMEMTTKSAGVIEYTDGLNLNNVVINSEDNSSIKMENNKKFKEKNSNF